jgi:hypothetical protein
VNKIQKLSRFFKWVFALILWGWPIVLCVIWFQNQNGFLAQTLGASRQSFLPSNLGDQALQPFSSSETLFSFGVAWIPTLLGMTIAFSLMRLFACYEQGAIFAEESIRHLRRVGAVMLLWAILNPLYQLLISFAVTFDNPVGERLIALSIGPDYFLNLIVSGIVFLIASIMQEGLKLKEEQALTV